MERTVWAEARREALKETFELVRLNGPLRVLLTIGVPIATVAGLWLVTGELAKASLLTLAATMAVGFLIFFGKLVTGPAKIAEEARARLSQQSADTDENERARRRSVMKRLVDLYGLEQGDDLRPTIKAGLELPPRDWLNERLAELGEVWQVADIQGASYQTLEMVPGEWRYNGQRMNSPAAVKWAAFFDALGLTWETGKQQPAVAKGFRVDFYLPQIKAWFAVTNGLREVQLDRFRALAAKSKERVIVADGAPVADKENLWLSDDADAAPYRLWAWAEDRRDQGVYWLTQLDDSAGICVGGPGTSTDHDRPPIMGKRIGSAISKAQKQPTPFTYADRR